MQDGTVISAAADTRVGHVTAASNVVAILQEHGLALVFHHPNTNLTHHLDMSIGRDLVDVAHHFLLERRLQHAAKQVIQLKTLIHIVRVEVNAGQISWK